MFYGWALYVICLVLLIIILLALYIRYQSSHGGIWINHIVIINIDDDKIYIIKQFVNTSEWTLKHTVKLSEITFSLDQNTSIVPLPICCCTGSYAFEKIIIVINLENGQKIKFNDSNAFLSMDQAKIYLDSVCNYLDSSQNQEPQNQQSEQQQQIVEQEEGEQDQTNPNTEHAIDVNDLEHPLL